MRVHTAAQVMIGGAIGAIFAIFWHLIVRNVIRPMYFDRLQQCAVGRFFLIRDCSHIDEIIRFEYDSVVQAPGSAFNRRIKAE
jgi:dolichyldiphosphatase